MRKFEFGSSAWLDELEGRIAGYAARCVPPQKVTICEIYEDVPRHLRTGSNADIAWHCRIDGRTVTFERSEIDQADFKARVDYAFALSLAKWIHKPATAAAYAALRSKGCRDGKLQVWGDPARTDFFRELHNEVVNFTL